MDSESETSSHLFSTQVRKNGLEMFSRTLNKLLGIFLILVFAQFVAPVGPAVAAELGLALDVLPSSDPDINRLTQGQALWFIIPPGSSKSRQVRVTSSSLINQEIELSVGYLNRIDGVATIDDSRKSETEDWAEFSPKKFILKPRASQLVDFKYSIPDSVEIGVHEAFLYATASQVTSKSNPEYRVPQNARIASPIFLGVGTSEQISTDFTIDDVSGVVVDGIRQLKVDFKNTGKTPLSLMGTIQLSSAEFENNLVGPLTFTSVVIRPGVLGYVLIPAPEQITPGKWKILVSATQISTTKTREFTKDLSFKPPSALLQNSLRALAAIIFFVIFGWCIRILRRPRKKSADGINPEISNLRAKTPFASNRNRGRTAEEAELEALIDDLLARSPLRKSPNAKKASVTKGVSKKPVKKVPAKKAAPRKPTAKKSPAKKVVKKMEKRPAKPAVKKKA
jgi:hypothetical protein